MLAQPLLPDAVTRLTGGANRQQQGVALGLAITRCCRQPLQLIGRPCRLAERGIGGGQLGRQGGGERILGVAEAERFKQGHGFGSALLLQH